MNLREGVVSIYSTTIFKLTDTSKSFNLCTHHLLKFNNAFFDSAMQIRQFERIIRGKLFIIKIIYLRNLKVSINFNIGVLSIFS